MESWETVGGRKKTIKTVGHGHRPSPSGGLLGGTNRGQGERSGGEEPNNGARDMVAGVKHLFKFLWPEPGTEHKYDGSPGNEKIPTSSDQSVEIYLYLT